MNIHTYREKKMYIEYKRKYLKIEGRVTLALRRSQTIAKQSEAISAVGRLSSDKRRNT